MDYDKQVDGNLAALNTYMNKQDEIETTLDWIIENNKTMAQQVANRFASVMDDFHTLKIQIAEELDDAGLNDDEQEVSNILSESADDVILGQMNNVDW